MYMYICICIYIYIKYVKKKYIYRPGWERHAIALTCAGTHHIKNTQAKFCPPKILYDMLFPVLLINSFTELLIMLLTLSICSETQFNPYCLKCFTRVSFVCIWSLRLCVSILWSQFLRNLCLTLSSKILLQSKKSNWFCFLYWPSLAL